jgi:hypothetical protein
MAVSELKSDHLFLALNSQPIFLRAGAQNTCIDWHATTERSGTVARPGCGHLSR